MTPARGLVSLRRHEQCLERRTETASNRTGTAGMAVAPYSAGDRCTSDPASWGSWYFLFLAPSQVDSTLGLKATRNDMASSKQPACEAVAGVPIVTRELGFCDRRATFECVDVNFRKARAPNWLPSFAFRSAKRNRHRENRCVGAPQVPLSAYPRVDAQVFPLPFSLFQLRVAFHIAKCAAFRVRWLTALSPE